MLLIDIHFISTFTFYSNLKIPKNKLSSVSLYKLNQIIEEKRAIQVNTIKIATTEEDILKLPLIYTRFKDVFFKVESDKIPPRYPYNYKIILESSKKDLGYSPLYKISLEELKVIIKYLKENLDKGFIELS